MEKITVVDTQSEIDESIDERDSADDDKVRLIKEPSFHNHMPAVRIS